MLSVTYLSYVCSIDESILILYKIAEKYGDQILSKTYEQKIHF